jgi:hypothetical protein
MTPEQEDLYRMAEHLLERTGKGKGEGFRRSHMTIDDGLVYVEDVVSDLLVAGPKGIVLSVNRSELGPIVRKWEPIHAAKVAAHLKQRFILELLSDV